MKKRTLSNQQSKWFILFIAFLAFMTCFTLEGGLVPISNEGQVVFIRIFEFLVLATLIVTFLVLLSYPEMGIELPYIKRSSKKEQEELKSILANKMKDAEGQELDDLMEKYKNL